MVGEIRSGANPAQYVLYRRSMPLQKERAHPNIIQPLGRPIPIFVPSCTRRGTYPFIAQNCPRIHSACNFAHDACRR